MRVFVVDDERKMGVILEGALRDWGHEVETFTRSQDLLDRVESGAPIDLLLTDLKMPPPDGLEVLTRVRARRPGTEVILMTAYATAQTAVEAMQRGAYDYLIKPFPLDELRIRVEKLEQERGKDENLRLLQRENALLKAEAGRTVRLGTVIGKSALMRDVLELAEKVADTDATVLIRGESGTGKSLIARAIHSLSPRAEGPMVTVNCGALPENLLESELFGHEKGAFTGAVARKAGRFATASGGTIFLDEVGEMPPALQVKLLQVLEEKEFTPVGSDTPRSADVRVIAATNRDLDEAIAEGEFREDLFYRLNVFPILVPPLRARREDIPLLVEHFLDRFQGRTGGLTSEASRALLEAPLPGNVRELENVLERAVILAGSDPIEPRHLPALSRGAGPGTPTGFTVPEIPDDGLSLEELEKELILKALDKAGGNKSQAARLLGLTRRTLYSRMERYGLGR